MGNARSVFVVVFAVRGVPVPVVDIVDVVAMRDGDVAASLAVRVGVLWVFNVLSAHFSYSLP
jgi:hypothetical protein